MTPRESALLEAAKEAWKELLSYGDRRTVMKLEEALRMYGGIMEIPYKCSYCGNRMNSSSCQKSHH